MKKVYIASSWKNRHAVEMLTALLRDLGYEVLSFIEREANAHKANFAEWMHSQDGKDAFSFDIHNATTADWVIYIGPSSIDTWAQIGAAWANNRIIVGLYAHGEQSGLMRLMVQHWFDDYRDLLKFLKSWDKPPKKSLKPYMYYNEEKGADEGALLIFHYTSREAKLFGWHNDPGIVDEFVNARARALKLEPHIMKQATSTIPHEVGSPESCKSCLLWGFELDKNGICELCRESEAGYTFEENFKSEPEAQNDNI